MNDQELTEGLKKGSSRAFEEFVKEYQSLVVNTCYGFLHQKEDAEDVAQDVFVEVFKKINQFRGDSKLSTWLYRIAANLSINYLRANKNNTALLRLEKDSTSYNQITNRIKDSKQTVPDIKMEEYERKKILYKAINELPENQKKAFTLNKFRDLSYKEISDIMKMSISAIESLLFRAKKNLQKKLLDYYKQS